MIRCYDIVIGGWGVPVRPAHPRTGKSFRFARTHAHTGYSGRTGAKSVRAVWPPGRFVAFLCTGMWVLSVSAYFLLPDSCFMWVLSGLVNWNSTFVHRHVGLKRFHGWGAQLLCTGVWVLSDFAHSWLLDSCFMWVSSGLLDWQLNFCVQACGT